MAEFNSPDVDSIKKTKDDLETKINELQGIGLPGIKDIPKTLWDNLIKPKLLSPRQVTKKFLMMQGQAFDPPLAEEDAQLIVYGKIYYKNGKLYDNDVKDPSCVAKPGDKDYQPPVDKNHPMWKKVEQMIKDLKDGLIQLGIKLGEFLFALPNAIITIAVSLVALVSSAIIFPPGAGIPTALSAVQTMMATIKELQSKTAAILPLLAIVDTIGLLLPKESQAIIAQVNVIFGIIFTIIASLLAIVGLLGKIVSKLGGAKKKMDEQQLKVETKAEPASVKQGESTKLSATATGGGWDFTFEWVDANGSVISNQEEVTVTPNIPTYNNPLNPITSSTTYTCKVKDTTNGTIKESTVRVSRI